jgi:hypothetical protein
VQRDFEIVTLSSKRVMRLAIANKRKCDAEKYRMLSIMIGS